MATFARLMRLSGAVLATAVLAAPVLGQSLDIRAPSGVPRATTGAAPAAAPAAAAAPTPAPEWSRAAARSDAGAEMERRVRRVQSSADDGAGDPRGCG